MECVLLLISHLHKEKHLCPKYVRCVTVIQLYYCIFKLNSSVTFILNLFVSAVK